MKRVFILLACLGVITFWGYEDIPVQANEAVKVAQDKSEQQMYLSVDIPFVQKKAKNTNTTPTVSKMLNSPILFHQ